MAVTLQHRRGTESQNNSFTGAVGEITVDTTNKRLRLHDGVKSGGDEVPTKAEVDGIVYFPTQSMTTLLALDTSVYTYASVIGYTTANDGGGGLFNYDATKNKSTANAGTIIDPSVSLALQGTGVGLGCWIRQYSGVVNVKWFGVVGDGTDSDMTRMLLANTLSATVGKLTFPKDTYVFNKPIPVWEGVEVECNNSTISFEGDATLGGFIMASRSSIRNVKQGYMRITNAIVGALSFITCGLFYGVGNVTRANYAGFIPNIVDANSVVGAWDAPTDITIENIHSDISGLAELAGVSVGTDLIFLTNFVKRINIDNISAKGNAVYVDYATSYVSTFGGILYDSNYYDVVRFEWGNFVSPNAHASGESFNISNIYGEGLRLHNHSGVVSMGNAHSFNVSNISGYRTGVVFHCGAAGISSNTSPDTVNFEQTMRSISNVKARDVYAFQEGGHAVGAIILNGTEDNTIAIPRSSMTILDGFNLIGIEDTTLARKYAGCGVLVGDQSWAGSWCNNVSVKNGQIHNFSQGVSLNNCSESVVDNCVISDIGEQGVLVVTQTAGQKGNNKISNCTIFNCNDYLATNTATNVGVGLTTYNTLDLVIEKCTFGIDGVAGTDNQLYAIFFRNGSSNFIKVRDCLFRNHAPTGSYDIYSNSASILYSVEGCRSIRTTSGLPACLTFKQDYGVRVVASGEFDYIGSVLNVKNLIGCSVIRSSTGRYYIALDTSAYTDDYTFIAQASGGSTEVYNTVAYTTLKAGVDFFVKNSTGTNIDPLKTISFNVFQTDNLTLPIV